MRCLEATPGLTRLVSGDFGGFIKVWDQLRLPIGCVTQKYRVSHQGLGRRRGHPAVEAEAEVGRQREERGRQEGLPLRGLLGGSEGKGD